MKYKNSEVNNISLWVVTAVLFLMPGLKEAGAAMDMANLARMLTIRSTAGDMGTNIYDIIQNPKHPVAALFSLLLRGMKMMKAPDRFAKEAKANRLIPATHLDALGSEVKMRMGQFDTLVKCL